jgi:putative phosphoribosyl transferase
MSLSDGRGLVALSEPVTIPAGRVELEGDLVVPTRAVGVVLFAHGSGSSRKSPRNRWVAGVLQSAGLGTLLFDLLTPDEAYDRRNVFHIPLLAHRLSQATTWLASTPAGELPVGYFGASTGAAAALWAAAEPESPVRAIVSRGGRPDLALERLPQVRAATLLIVGSRDPEVLALNQLAQSRLRSENRLEIVPGATHLFEEPGTLDIAASLARDWFLIHLPVHSPAG